MSSLIAYIPVLNQRHLDWFKKHKASNLFLITQKMAEELVPRLSRNIVGVPTEVMVRILQTVLVDGTRVSEFDPDWDDPDLLASHGVWKNWVLPDEDVSHELVRRFLRPAGCEVSFEMIWARYDMTAVLKNQPVVPNFEVSASEFDMEFMQKVRIIAGQSSDWWRQIGAAALSSRNEFLVSAYNTHMPNEYETYIFGDPSLNRDAGKRGKSCALHAENAVITLCAKHGLALEGATMYVTTFPCEECARQIAFAGVRKVFFQDGYSSLNAQETLQAYDVEIVRVNL